MPAPRPAPRALPGRRAADGTGVVVEPVPHQLGIEPATFFKASAQRYRVDVATHGISLELSQHDDATASTNDVSADQHYNGWALHSVKLYSTQQTATAKRLHGVWARPWPAGIDAEHTTFDHAEQRLVQDHSGPPTKADPRVSFFRAGLHGMPASLN